MKKLLLVFAVALIAATGLTLSFQAQIGCALGKAVSCREAGDSFFSEDNYDAERALGYYLRALYLGGEDPYTLYQTGRLYFILGKTQFSIFYLDKTLQLAPNFYQALYMRGLTNSFAHRLDQAEADFKVYLSVKPEVWAGYNDLAWVYFEKEDYKSLDRVAREGLGRFPGNPWLLNVLGLGLMNRGFYPESIIAFKDSLVGFERVKTQEWGMAYPGDSPKTWAEGLQNAILAIKANIVLTEEKMQKSVGQ